MTAPEPVDAAAGNAETTTTRTTTTTVTTSVTTTSTTATPGSASSAGSGDPSAATGPTGPGSGGPAGRVLVVDDEIGIRIALGRALARCGYEVFLADGAAAALTQLRGGPQMAVVVSDITMPSMNGVELATAILAEFPGTPILFVTGSAATPTLLSSPLIDLIAKPVRVADLRERVRRMVDRAGAGVATPASGEPAGSDAA